MSKFNIGNVVRVKDPSKDPDINDVDLLIRITAVHEEDDEYKVIVLKCFNEFYGKAERGSIEYIDQHGKIPLSHVLKEL